MDKLTARGLDATGLSDGLYRLEVADGKATGWSQVTSSALDAVIVTVVNGVPMLMFDADSTPVTTEVPS